MEKLLKVFLGLIMLTSCIHSSAQVDTSTTQKLLQYIMNPLDKNQISTGFLEEYGCPMLPAATFNGTLTDSNRIDMNLWRTLYLQLQTGWTRATANPLPAITSVNTTIKQNVSSTLPIPIPLLIASYNTVKSNAFSSNLLNYNSSTKQISDVAGRTQSPYDPKTLYAACPNKNITTTGTESFIIQSSMIWNNTGKSISQIQIDFANGQGFQSVTVGTPKSISYADTGFKKWTIKVTLSDNSILQCFNEYNVLKTANITSRYQPSESIKPMPWGDVIALTGVRSGATIWINYSKNNPTGILRKPLIVVEGYDVSFIAPSLQPNNYGRKDFIDGLDEANLASWNFNTQLDDIAGYDLVFVDFADGAADIVLNGGAVQEVINRVNANKVNDNRFGNIRQQNVVMGLSMGGLCARYALANMTKNFTATPTETRLLITHDSPHKGANVPLGLQYMIRMLGGVQLFGYNVYDIYPEYNDAISLLDAPATTQLLLYRATTTNAFANNTFLDATYRPMITFGSTDPQPTYRFVSTALGNECANPLFAPGKTFINLAAGVSAGIYTRFLFFKVPILDYKLAAAVEAYALPTAGSTNKIARVYTINNLKLFGFINIFKQLYDNTAYAPGTHLAVDGVPGSNYPLLNVDALNQLTSLPIFKVNLYVSFPLGPFLGGYFGLYAYNAGVSYNFTFVSTASALDASPYSTPIFSQKYVNGTNQSYPSSSETFIAQETVQNNPSLTNNVHIRFTARNSRWLFNEMENLNNPENCSSDCSNPYYLSGNSPICTSGIYSIPGLQRGATVSWNIPQTSIANPNPTAGSQTTTVTKVSDGIATLTATITACGSTTTASKIIAVGKPKPGIITFPLIDPTFGRIQATVDPVPDAKLYNWYKNGILVSTYHGTFAIIPISKTACNIEYDISIEAINSCGTSLQSHANAFVPCANYYMISPNPATSDVTVSTNESKMQRTSNNTFDEVRIYNSKGSLKKYYKFNKVDNAKINFDDLTNGIYFVEIVNGAYKEKIQLLIQK